MPFGKFAGLDLADIPSDYLTWLLGLDDLREPLKAAAWSEYRRRVDAQEGRAVSTLDADRVKRVYRTLAMEYHPDHGGNEDIMKGLNIFFEALQ